MLLALRDALAAADGGAIRLTDLARQVDAEPTVVRAVLAHGAARGWFPDVRVLTDAVPAATGEGGATARTCGAASCVPAPANPHCRRCPMAS
jgi:hypothetical protein